MISRTGTVVKTDQDHLQVNFALANACSNCADNAGCGILPIARFIQRADGATIEVPLRNFQLPDTDHDDPATAVDCRSLQGQRVQVAIDSKRFLWLVTAGYGLPVVGLLGGALLAQTLFPAGGDGGAVLGAGIGATVIYVLQRATRAIDHSVEWLRVRVLPADF